VAAKLLENNEETIIQSWDNCVTYYRYVADSLRRY